MTHHQDGPFLSRPLESTGAPASDLPQEGEVRHPLPQFAPYGRNGKIILSAIAVFSLVVAGWQLAQHRPPVLGLGVAMPPLVLWWRVRRRGRDAVANADGVRGPHLRHPIRWSDVAYLEQPTRFDPSVVVRLRDGSRQATGIPAEDVGRLARISGKAVVKSPPR